MRQVQLGVGFGCSVREKNFIASVAITTTISFFTIMAEQQQKSSSGGGRHGPHSIWTEIENEQLMQWLEDPENLRKMKKGSGVSKKALIAEISLQIPTKPTIKVGYKYDNLLKSYRAAAKLNNQSGWGLTEKDMDEGRRSLRGMYINIKHDLYLQGIKKERKTQGRESKRRKKGKKSKC